MPINDAYLDRRNMTVARSNGFDIGFVRNQNFWSTAWILLSSYDSFLHKFLKSKLMEKNILWILLDMLFDAKNLTRK